MACRSKAKRAPVRGDGKRVVRFALVVSFVLTLGTWLFFYYSPVTTLDPLTGPETTFVFAIWFGLACVTRWFWLRGKKR